MNVCGLSGCSAFSCPAGLKALRASHPRIGRSHACKRRRPETDVVTSHGRGANIPRMKGKLNKAKSKDSPTDPQRIAEEHARLRRMNAEVPGTPPLPPTPAEISGFDGWRDQDDDYWKDFRKREVSFRAPTTYQPDDLESPPPPRDRHGRIPTYSAAVKYSHEVGQWIPTTAEEEERLRNPQPTMDPYFVQEAMPGEAHTTLYPQKSTGSSEDDSEPREVFKAGGLEFSNPPVRDLSPHRRKRLNMKPGGWRVVHLGTSSAVPTLKRNVSSTAVIMNSERREAQEPSMFLVDAGENTDERLLQCDWCMTHGFRWIRAIFITHLHGDHIYGLPMLLANIGEYAQHRRRKAIENGEDGSDPVIAIYGPYGTRGFLRSSLYWTNPVGVRFSVSELVPRDIDFRELRPNDGGAAGQVFIVEDGINITKSSGCDSRKESPPPHPEEVRAEDIHAGEDGLWHVWEENHGSVKTEIVAAPLRHRMPCFGYVFRERIEDVISHELDGTAMTNKTQENVPKSTHNGSVVHDKLTTSSFEIDMVKARELGVHGTQLRVLRSGRSITVSKTGRVVRPEDVGLVKPVAPAAVTSNKETTTTKGMPETCFRRKVTILGDTCDSSAIAEAAMGSDLLVHEATFTDWLKEKARVAMHSTARMAGEFAHQIQARKLALTHFSSRYEYFQQMAEDSEREQELFRIKSVQLEMGNEDTGEVELESTGDEDLASPNILVREALSGYGDNRANIVAAYDFLEHDIVPRGEMVQHGVVDTARSDMVHVKLKQ